jgi:putative sigma-54 modulation protein
MQVKVTGRHMSVTDAMKAYAEEKAQKLIRFFDRIQEIRIVLDFDGSRPTVECIVDVEHAEDFIAHEANDDMYAAIDKVSDKLERQLRKHKERIREHHKSREDETTQ